MQVQANASLIGESAVSLTLLEGGHLAVGTYGEVLLFESARISLALLQSSRAVPEHMRGVELRDAGHIVAGVRSAILEGISGVRPRTTAVTVEPRYCVQGLGLVSYTATAAGAECCSFRRRVCLGSGCAGEQPQHCVLFTLQLGIHVHFTRTVSILLYSSLAACILVDRSTSCYVGGRRCGPSALQKQLSFFRSLLDTCCHSPAARSQRCGVVPGWQHFDCNEAVWQVLNGHARGSQPR